MNENELVVISLDDKRQVLRRQNHFQKFDTTVFCPDHVEMTLREETDVELMYTTVDQSDDNGMHVMCGSEPEDAKLVILTYVKETDTTDSMTSSVIVTPVFLDTEKKYSMPDFLELMKHVSFTPRKRAD